MALLFALSTKIEYISGTLVEYNFVELTVLSLC